MSRRRPARSLRWRARREKFLGPEPDLEVEEALSEAEFEPADQGELKAATGKAQGRPLVRARLHPIMLGAVGLGGSFGTFGRYEVGLRWPDHAGDFPTTIFTINSTGALLIGTAMALIVTQPHRSSLWRPLLCVGVLGGWTTMSTLALQADQLVGRKDSLTAVFYVVATIVVGLIATFAGTQIARVSHSWLTDRRPGARQGNQYGQNN